MLGRLKHLWRLKVTCKGDPCRYAQLMGVRLGQGCRILSDPRAVFGSEPYLVSLGDRVSITGGVRFVTHEGGVWVLRGEEPEIDVFAPIRVGSNVFIGLNAILLPGTTVGDNVVIAAGALVRGNIPSDSIVAGVPAKVIGSRQDFAQRMLPRAERIRSWDEARKREYLEAKYRP